MQVRLSRQLATAVAGLVEAESAISHYDLDRLIAEAGLTATDPKRFSQALVGKHKRIEGVLQAAAMNQSEAGGQLVIRLLETMQGCGDFAPTSRLRGSAALSTAQEACRREGLRLSDDGTLMQLSLEGLSGAELTDALQVYVRRAQTGATDAALVTGTSKDLVEAVARHVLVMKVGDYQRSMDFAGTLYQAFLACDLPVPSGKALSAVQHELSSDARVRMIECLYLLATAVNRLRNEEGTGHGRPFPANVSDEEAKVAVEAMGLVSELLLGRA